MSAYDYNPDTCRNIFHGIADEIASSVRTVDVPNVSANFVFTDEMRSYCEEFVSDSFKGAIDRVWGHYEIANKLQQCKSMDSSPKELAVKSLIEWKECLTKEISNLKEESIKELEEINRTQNEFKKTAQNRKCKESL